MHKVLGIIALLALLAGCESMYQDDGVPRIRSQADVDAYNATVSSDSEKLVCSRERVIGSNIREWVCMTIAQQDRLAAAAREQVDNANLR